VRVELKEQRCDTPCALQLPAGEHRARIDGLDRTLVAYDVESHVYVRPTRRGRLAVGAAALLLGSTGLTLAGHWASPLDNRQRLISGLAGAGFTVIAVPLLISSSARVYDWRSKRAPTFRPGEVELLAGAQLVRGTDQLFATAGIGYRFENSRFGMRAAGRFATDELGVYQLVLGGTVYAPRLPIVQPTLSIAGGLAQVRTIDAELMQVTGTRTRPLLELDAQLSIEVPRWPVKPRIGGLVQLFADDGEAALVGDELGLIARL
jgi:hypothetical protein